MSPLSDRTAHFTDSVIRRMTRIANQYGAVNLSQGFPDFDPPKEITDRLAEVAPIGPHQYALTWGAQNFREALADNQITPDETRLLTECAIHADKVAVDEELVRLGAHFEAFEKILSDGDAVGRRLDFLLQEMNREVNTTGSKCSDASIAAIVVDAKCELEKIREQIQNLE